MHRTQSIDDCFMVVPLVQTGSGDNGFHICTQFQRILCRKGIKMEKHVFHCFQLRNMFGGKPALVLFQ